MNGGCGVRCGKGFAAQAYCCVEVDKKQYPQDHIEKDVKELCFRGIEALRHDALNAHNHDPIVLSFLQHTGSQGGLLDPCAVCRHASYALRVMGSVHDGQQLGRRQDWKDH